MSDIVDNRSPDLAYMTKTNIVFPGNATQRDAALDRGAKRSEDRSRDGVDADNDGNGARTCSVLTGKNDTWGLDRVGKPYKLPAVP